MILVGSQRGGARQLAVHLMNDRDNDHVTVQELRGFSARNLPGAFIEVEAISSATQCRQPLFSLSLNPPKGADVPVKDLMAAIDRAEERLGLSGQPRAVVIHEKEGRRHAHAVWSRIDGEKMTAINLPYFKTRLKGLSKELFLDHGWDLPEGHRTNGWKNPLNFTLAEWQQAKRLDLDPREIKQLFRDAWAHSDNKKSFGAALEQSGFYLARGDRRGFVALDLYGNAYSVSRWAGLKAREVKQRLGDPSGLPSVADVRAATRKRLGHTVRSYMHEMRDEQRQDAKPLADERKAMVAAQRTERRNLDQGQDTRRKAEAKERAARLHSGLRGAWELLTGKARAVRHQNEADAYRAFLRDRDQRERLHRAQMKDRAGLQERIEAQRKTQRQERLRLMRRVAEVLRRTKENERRQERERTRPGRRSAPDFDLDL